MQLTFVTGNKNKVREAEKILGFPIKIENLDLDEIQEVDVEKIALHKVNQAIKKIKQPVFVDDVGMYIEAWNGFPGTLIKHVLEIDENKTFTKWMLGEQNRAAKVVCVIGFHDGKKTHTFTGEVDGLIVEPRGKGWGFRPIFQPNKSQKTWGEISDETLNKISHRRLALEKLKKHLTQNT